jgi:hypothetical protein
MIVAPMMPATIANVQLIQKHFDQPCSDSPSVISRSIGETFAEAALKPSRLRSEQSCDTSA